MTTSSIRCGQKNRFVRQVEEAVHLLGPGRRADCECLRTIGDPDTIAARAVKFENEQVNIKNSKLMGLAGKRALLSLIGYVQTSLYKYMVCLRVLASSRISAARRRNKPFAATKCGETGCFVV